MSIRKRSALAVAGLAATAVVALPAQNAPAWEQCYAVFSEGGDICIGGSECNQIGERVEKVTGQRWECLQ